MKLTSPLKYRKGQKTIISQPFGVNYEKYKHHGIKGHNGIDFVNGNEMDCYGIGITAAHKGEVVALVATDPMSTYGNGVYIQEQEGDKLYKSVYWHLSKVLVKVGDNVSQGQLIGRMGNSGIVRPKPEIGRPYKGTHLHFGLYVYNKNGNGWVRSNTDYKGAVDPMPYFTDRTIAKHFKEQLEKPSIERMSIVLAPILWAFKKFRIVFKGRL